MLPNTEHNFRVPPYRLSPHVPEVELKLGSQQTLSVSAHEMKLACTELKSSLCSNFWCTPALAQFANYFIVHSGSQLNFLLYRELQSKSPRFVRLVS